MIPDTFVASDWAKAFIEAVEEDPSLATDEPSMHIWFAKALMRGYEEAV